MIAVNVLLGVGLHGVGAFFAASCYTPRKKAITHVRLCLKERIGRRTVGIVG